jgi:peptide subunit release factor 1 (eRF1)
LASELGTADCVKDRKNAKYIKKGLTYALGYLKTLKVLPPNGLALFSGENWYYI